MIKDYKQLQYPWVPIKPGDSIQPGMVVKDNEGLILLVGDIEAGTAPLDYCNGCSNPANITHWSWLYDGTQDRTKGEKYF
jgi:hypothetical protein